MSIKLPTFVLSSVLAASPAVSGGLDASVIEPTVVAEELTGSASHDWIVPMLLVLLAAAASN
jgi:hypothetical protein